jgi:hypothetical protein
VPLPVKANHHKISMDHDLWKDMKRTVQVLKRLDAMIAENETRGLALSPDAPKKPPRKTGQT